MWVNIWLLIALIVLKILLFILLIGITLKSIELDCKLERNITTSWNTRLSRRIFYYYYTFLCFLSIGTRVGIYRGKFIKSKARGARFNNHSFLNFGY
jgi:hypothetical protein